MAPPPAVLAILWGLTFPIPQRYTSTSLPFRNSALIRRGEGWNTEDSEPRRRHVASGGSYKLHPFMDFAVGADADIMDSFRFRDAG